MKRGEREKEPQPGSRSIGEPTPSWETGEVRTIPLRDEVWTDELPERPHR